PVPSATDFRRHAEFAEKSINRIRGANIMDRRTFLKTAAGAGALTAAGGFATPAISQRAAARALRFVPQADLANFDPVLNTAVLVRNASALVWDTLYGVDDKLRPQRQMGRKRFPQMVSPGHSGCGRG